MLLEKCHFYAIRDKVNFKEMTVFDKAPKCNKADYLFPAFLIPRKLSRLLIPSAAESSCQLIV